jgi:putative Mg2+ transporter-C (MgtC) family protein
MDILTQLNQPALIPFIQIVIAMICGLILGIERVLAGRTAGPRTYALVCMGACLLTIMSLNAASRYPDLKSLDPIPLVSSIISGIGFLGAGLIIFQQSKLSGITTAAGIWVAAAIGIAVGYHFYALAFFTTVLTMFLFTIAWQLENKLKGIFVPQSKPLDSKEYLDN